jgi:sphinganine-1-phosphate aldolase
METEIVSMTAAMLNGDDNASGFLTSGGTESILMAVKTYRDRAHKLFPHIKHPEIVRRTITVLFCCCCFFFFYFVA